jgi:hypothetical protein
MLRHDVDTFDNGAVLGYDYLEHTSRLALVLTGVHINRISFFDM